MGTRELPFLAAVAGRVGNTGGARESPLECNVAVHPACNGKMRAIHTTAARG